MFSGPFAVVSAAGLLLVGSIGFTGELPDFTDTSLQQLLLREALKAPASLGVVDITDRAVSPHTAGLCRLPANERAAYFGLGEKTIVPVSAYFKMLSDYQARCQLRVVISGSPAGRTVHAVYNGPIMAGRPTTVRYSDPSGTLRVTVLKRHLDPAAFEAAAMSIAESDR